MHNTSLSEIRTVLGFSAHRNKLIDGLEEFMQVWSNSGFVSYSIIDGSFVTSKPEPADIDIILVPNSEALFSERFNRLARSHSYDRDFTKSEFGCEAFLTSGQDNLDGWLAFFGRDRQGRVRGLLRLQFHSDGTRDTPQH